MRFQENHRSIASARIDTTWSFIAYANCKCGLQENSFILYVAPWSLRNSSAKKKDRNGQHRESLVQGTPSLSWRTRMSRDLETVSNCWTWYLQNFGLEVCSSPRGWTLQLRWFIIAVHLRFNLSWGCRHSGYLNRTYRMRYVICGLLKLSAHMPLKNCSLCLVKNKWEEESTSQAIVDCIYYRWDNRCRRWLENTHLQMATV